MQTVPSKSESVKLTRTQRAEVLEPLSRPELLRLCRTMRVSAHRLKTDAEIRRVILDATD